MASRIAKRRCRRPRVVLGALVVVLSASIPCLMAGRSEASLVDLVDRFDDEGPTVGVPLTVGAYLGAAVGVPLGLMTGLGCLPVYPLYDAAQERHYDTSEQCYWIGAGVVIGSAAGGAAIVGAPFYGVAKAVDGFE